MNPVKRLLSFALVFFLLLNICDAQNTKILHFKELQKYLPSSIKGYTADAQPNGNTITMGDQVFSTVEQNFVREDIYLKITIFDYFQAAQLFEQSALIWTQGFSLVNDEGFARTLKFAQPDVAGWETFDAESQTAEIFVGIKNRFFIIINAEGQRDTGFIKSLAEPIINQLLKL